MKFQEINKKSEQELLEMINDLRAELFTLRFKNKTHQQDQTHKISLIRKDIARVLTALRQRQLGIKVDEKKAKKSDKGDK